MRGKAEMHRRLAIDIYQVPLLRYQVRSEVFRTCECQIEDLLKQGSSFGRMEHQSVIRLYVNPPEAEVGRAEEDLHRFTISLCNEHLVMLQTLEVHAFDIVRAGRRREALGSLGFCACIRFVLTRVIDDGSEASTNFLQKPDDVRFVQVICEKVKSEGLVAGYILQEIKNQLTGLKSQPIVDIAGDFIEVESLIGLHWNDIRIVSIPIGVSLR